MTNRQIKIVQLQSMIRQMIGDLKDSSSTIPESLRVIFIANWETIYRTMEVHSNVYSDELIEEVSKDLRISMTNAWNAVGRKVA